MGSSGTEFLATWVWIATLSGLLYLIFDAGRYFTEQLSPVRLRRLTSEEGNRWTRYDPENFQLVTTGALQQVALIVAFGCTTLATGSFGRALLIWVTIILIWKFILRLIPEDAAEIGLRGLIPLSHFFYVLFFPILFPLRHAMARLKRDKNLADEEDEEVTDEEVQAYIDVGEEEGILEGTEGRLLQSIVDFGDRVARELMTPRIDMMAFDARRHIEELAKMFSETKYSRIPIYTQSIDQITGIVHIKEIFDAILKNENKPATELARPPYFVSETKKVSELLKEFQSEHLQVAIVVDEYGGTAGIVTIEDIVEEIVGEIADEHEDEEVTIVHLGDDAYLVSGLARVEDLEEMLEAQLSGEDYETVAGLIFTTLGRVPKVGTAVSKNGFRFEVDRADRRRIYRVKVSKEKELPPDDDDED
ncbi:MAG TPA: hemolysin family protein [Thermoanaerobaculia bacterium]|nr:hemolysin family protein [Thermoanaerobaculia bacterium]